MGGVILEVSWDEHEREEDTQRLKWNDDFRYKELWVKVGEYFRDGGAGVVVYLGKHSRRSPLGGITYTHRVRILTEARADAIYARLLENEARLRQGG